MGLLQARLRSRLQASRASPASPSSTSACCRTDPTGPGMQLLIDLSTVNHTAFFREPAPLHVHGRAARRRSSRTANGGPIRIWSAGCSTGQEPYSMAMVLAETIAEPLAAARCEIWASDLSLRGAQGRRPGDLQRRATSQGVSPARLRRFFLRGRGPRGRLVPGRARDPRPGQVPAPRPARPGLAAARPTSTSSSAATSRSTSPRTSGWTCSTAWRSHLRPGGWLAIGNGEILPGVPASLRKHRPVDLPEGGD